MQVFIVNNTLTDDTITVIIYVKVTKLNWDDVKIENTEQTEGKI